MKIKSDDLLNSQLKQEIQTLRKGINKGKNLKRFVKTPNDDNPTYTITDIKTGKKTVVPLFALPQVMNVLSDLFE